MGATLEAVAAAEQRAVNLEGEVARLNLELKGVGQQQASLREQLKGSREWVRSMDDRLLDLSRSLEEGRGGSDGGNQCGPCKKIKN